MAAEVSDIRRSAFLLLTACAVAIAAAKTVGGENVYEPSRYAPPVGKDGKKSGYGYEPDRVWLDKRPDPAPMFSSNDKSRWATVRALVHDKTYVIGKRLDPKTPKSDTGIVADPAYASTDVVLNPETQEFYSSKPPLMATIAAGQYWLLRQAFGWDIVHDRWLVIPAIVLMWNVVPFAIYLILLGRLIDRIGKTDYGKLLAFATAALGTFLITFSGTLNNHSPAAFCVLFATYPLLRAILDNRDMMRWEYACCGFFAGFAATFELPALALVGAMGLPLLIARPRNTLLFFIPCAALPIIALYCSNYVALGTFEPVYEKFGGPWYRYEGSHWSKIGTPRAKGLDFNNEPTTVYAFHLLVGHHGWFSLTPVWCVALIGLAVMGIKSAPAVRALRKAKGTGWTLEMFSAMTLAVSLVVFAFYLTRTQSYNYGGNTCGPRWLFWLIPLWVVAVPPVADRLARSGGGRLLGAVLLGASALSVFYPAWNPWRNPWILQLLEFKGWLRY